MRNIPLRVDLKQGTQSWKDEVLMIQEGQCWAVDDVRYPATTAMRQPDAATESGETLIPELKRRR